MLSSPILVGRDKELERLVQAAAHPPAAVLVEGQAGVGKSRLVAELAAHPALAGFPVLVGRCTPMREPFLLGPVVDALRCLRPPFPGGGLPPIASAARPLLPELADHLPGPAAPSGEAIIDRHVLFRALAAVAASVGPAVLVLEDLHWMDEATLEFTRFLLADLPADLVLVLTYRPEDMATLTPLGGTYRPPSGLPVIRLGLAELGRADVADLVRALTGADDLSAELVACVHRHTGGLPFAVEELVRHALDAGLFEGTTLSAAQWDFDALGVPPALRDLVLGRVAALGGDALSAVRAAAVLEEPSSELLLGWVAGLGARRASVALSRALRAGVLVENRPDRYGFRHPLAARSVYESLPRPQRARLHARAAALLEHDPAAYHAQLAYHYRGAGDLARWLAYAEAAGRAALSAGDASTAVAVLREPLVVDLPVAARVRLATDVAYAGMLAGAGGQREAAALLAKTIAEPGLCTPDRGRLRLLLGRLLSWSGDSAASYEELVRCLDELQGQPHSIVHVMAELATVHHLGVGAPQRREWLARATDLAATLGDAATDSEVAAARANLLLTLADPAAWAAMDEVAAHATSPTGDRRNSWTWLRWAVSCTYLGHYRRARGLLVRVADGDDIAHSWLSTSREGAEIVLDWVEGEWSELETRARSHALITDDSVYSYVQSAQVLGLLALARGDLDVAEHWLAGCAGRARPAGLARSVAVATAGLARIRLRRGAPEAGLQVATRGLEEISAPGVWPWATELLPAAVEAALACHRRDDAQVLVTRFAAGIRGCDVPLGQAFVGLCRAMLAEAEGRLVPAARAFGRAQRALGALPRPHEAAIAGVSRGRCLIAAGEDAAHLLASAHARLTTLGAVADAHDVEGLLVGRADRAVTAPPAPRRGRPGYGAQVSPREAQVAELAATGLTNLEIAAKLGISPRTVDHHVAAVVRKLGLASKRALRRTDVSTPPEAGIL